MKKQHQVELEWKNDLSFNVGVDDHLIVLDGIDEHKGLCPKPLMLASLAGCTAMDVVGSLKETRTRFNKFGVQVIGELTKEVPQTYAKVHVHYKFEGTELDKARIEEAVLLSVNIQCGVLMMFKKFAEVTHEIEFTQG
jgi:putative redox protein